MAPEGSADVRRKDKPQGQKEYLAGWAVFAAYALPPHGQKYQAV